MSLSQSHFFHPWGTKRQVRLWEEPRQDDEGPWEDDLPLAEWRYRHKKSCKMVSGSFVLGKSSNQNVVENNVTMAKEAGLFMPPLSMILMY